MFHCWRFDERTFSVTYWQRSRSWSPSGRISGSTIGTRPFWWRTNININNLQPIFFITTIPLESMAAHAPVGRYWHIWRGHWRSLRWRERLGSCRRSSARTSTWRSHSRPSCTGHSAPRGRRDLQEKNKPRGVGVLWWSCSFCMKHSKKC